MKKCNNIFLVDFSKNSIAFINYYWYYNVDREEVKITQKLFFQEECLNDRI